jgi:hypothetical protein
MADINNTVKINSDCSDFSTERLSEDESTTAFRFITFQDPNTVKSKSIQTVIRRHGVKRSAKERERTMVKTTATSDEVSHPTFDQEHPVRFGRDSPATKPTRVESKDQISMNYGQALGLSVGMQLDAHDFDPFRTLPVCPSRLQALASISIVHIN